MDFESGMGFEKSRWNLKIELDLGFGNQEGI